MYLPRKKSSVIQILHPQMTPNPNPNPRRKVPVAPEILREAISLFLRRRNLILSTLLLFLLPCNLLLTAIAELNPVPVRLDLASVLRFNNLAHTTTEFKSSLEFELVGSVLWWLSTTVGTYLLSLAYIIGNPSSLVGLLSKLRKEWKRILITSLSAELIATTYSSILLALSLPLRFHAYKSSALSVVLAAVAMVAAFAVFVFVSLACRLGLVVAAVEEGCSGFGALQRAGEIIRGRKLQGFAMMCLVMLMEQVTVDMEFEKSDEVHKGNTVWWRVLVGGLLGVPVELLLQLLGCFLCCILYLIGSEKYSLQ